MTKTITISDETYELIKDKLSTTEKMDIGSLEDLVGQKIFVRTVTHYVVGKVERVIGQFVEMSDASWIPDTGRFMDFLKNGTLSEVEPTGQHYVNLGASVDWFPWNHDLPTEQQ